MSFKPPQDHPEWWQAVATLTILVVSISAGLISKIADDVKVGNRDRFWGKSLFLEVPSVVMMALAGWGVAEHYALGAGTTATLGAFLGWSGPKTVSVIVASVLPKSGRK